MEVIEGWTAVPAHLRGSSLAIGTFDGVHRGHRAVLTAARSAAEPLGVPWGAMIFEPHPREYFQPDRPFFRLTALPRKLHLLRALGCDLTAIIPFGREVAELSAEAFVRDVLVESYRVRHVAAGFNFYFGKGRGGNPARLAELGPAHGFGVSIVEPQGGAGEIYSSTGIRELLAEGDVAGATAMLGDYWRLEGVVESGAGRGSGLGFPTANIRLEQGVTLKHGVYAVCAYVEGLVLNGAAYLGTRPTFDAGMPLLETFLLDFDGSLYGKKLEIEFVAFLREDAKFRSAEALAAQMTADCGEARRVLSALCERQAASAE